MATLQAPDTESEPVEVELFCRASTTTASAIDRYHGDLTSLEATGVVDDVEVVTWPSRIELSTGSESRGARAYDEFVEWADRTGRRLAPAFDVESYESTFTGESGTALVTPIACVAAYRDGDLAAVFPHVEDGEVVDVEDGIERLREWDDSGPERRSRAVVAGTQD